MNFLPIKSYSQVDTFVCDNGGFEQDFLYYSGSIAIYEYGGNICIPMNDSLPSVWTPSILPSFRRFEIVTSGVDPLVGIQKTKFGNKSLLLNNKYGIYSALCSGNKDINKISKRFKVTEENRKFTLWYAVVLENPAGHTTTQPYFSIQCDLAPSYNLCFDASNISCPKNYSDPLCSFDELDVVDWICHRINIPIEYVGEIATIEITVADCGAGEHFAYAYIDGFCEECTGSADGSTTLLDFPFDTLGLHSYNKTCEGDSIKICGFYSLPTLCGNWNFDSIKVLGAVITNLEVDTSNKSYCFYLLKSLFPNNGCFDIFAYAYFSSPFYSLPPVISNTVKVCPEDFKKYEVSVSTGICDDNETIDLISDDYYYVTVNLTNFEADSFLIDRTLDDPYPNESGYQILKQSAGDGVIYLGPFLIQEGGWTLKVKVKNCEYSFHINPPIYCSGCDKFYSTYISNISCNGNATNGDTWSFQIYVPGNGDYYFYEEGQTPIIYQYNATNTIINNSIDLVCKVYILEDFITGCKSKLIVCPPKPCSVNCNLEVNIEELYCLPEQSGYSINISASGSGYLCYKTIDIDGPFTPTNPNNSQGSIISNPFTIGQFTDDIYLTIYSCLTPDCSCINPQCFKITFIPYPDCEYNQFNGRSKNAISNLIPEFTIYPHPVYNDEIVLHSSFEETKFQLYNSSGQLLHSSKFKGDKYVFKKQLNSGIYFIKYSGNQSIFKTIKLLKI